MEDSRAAPVGLSWLHVLRFLFFDQWLRNAVQQCDGAELGELESRRQPGSRPRHAGRRGAIGSCVPSPCPSAHIDVKLVPTNSGKTLPRGLWGWASSSGHRTRTTCAARPLCRLAVARRPDAAHPCVSSRVQTMMDSQRELGVLRPSHASDPREDTRPRRCGCSQWRRKAGGGAGGLLAGAVGCSLPGHLCMMLKMRMRPD